MSQRLNSVTHRLEQLGFVVLKDENGKYVTRGNRNLKINGENIKPILVSDPFFRTNGLIDRIKKIASIE